MIWLTLVTILIPVVIGSVQSFHEKERSKRHRGLMISLVIIAGVVSGYTAWVSAGEARVSTEEARSLNKQREKWEKTTSTDILYLGGKIGDLDLAKRYVEALKPATSQISADEAAIAMKQYLETKAAREQLRQRTNEANKQVFAATVSNLQPVLDTITTRFDAWVVEVAKLNVKIANKKTDQAAVVPLSFPRTWALIREATFENGDRLVANFLPIVVEDARVEEELYVYFYFYSHSSPDVPLHLLAVLLGEKNQGINNPKPGKVHYEGYNGTAENPFLDATFRQRLNIALNEVTAYSLTEATRQDGSRIP
ncbi:MAG: hypothetical protein JWM88_788 [Verrucomicrobia bacterium]|nr:hypothetical protein [Verrucomicrobiota bacterium]